MRDQSSGAPALVALGTILGLHAIGGLMSRKAVREMLFVAGSAAVEAPAPAPGAAAVFDGPSKAT